MENPRKIEANEPFRVHFFAFFFFTSDSPVRSPVPQVGFAFFSTFVLFFFFSSFSSSPHVSSRRSLYELHIKYVPSRCLWCRLQFVKLDFPKIAANCFPHVLHVSFSYTLCINAILKLVDYVLLFSFMCINVIKIKEDERSCNNLIKIKYK